MSYDHLVGNKLVEIREVLEGSQNYLLSIASSLEILADKGITIPAPIINVHVNTTSEMSAEDIANAINYALERMKK